MKFSLNNSHKRRCWLIFFLIVGSVSAAFLIMHALKRNINLYFTPTQITTADIPKNARIRVGGIVEKNSIQRKDNLTVHFVITDYQERLAVQYEGILPDLFREEKGVVVLGNFSTAKLFVADEVLAKHDENYMPPVIKEKKS